MYRLFEDDNMRTITFSFEVPLTTMQRVLVGFNQLAGTVSDSDFFHLNLLARMPYGIVGICSLAHSIRLQCDCRNAFVDKTLQVGIDRMR